jgi:hypothetical protein
MTSAAGGVGTYLPTYHAANLLIAGGAGQSSHAADWRAVAAVAVAALAVALGAFWLAARSRS